MDFVSIQVGVVAADRDPDFFSQAKKDVLDFPGRLELTTVTSSSVVSK
jgi:hypothetical protein